MKRSAVFGVVLALFVSMCAFHAHAFGETPVQIKTVEVDNTELSLNSQNYLNVKRGEEIEVRVVAEFYEPLELVRIEASIPGYEFDTLRVASDVFDVESASDTHRVTTPITLKLELPDDIEKNEYPLRISVSAKNHQDFDETYNLLISQKRRDVLVKDVMVQPRYEVRSGTSIFVTARVENEGAKDEENVRVEFRIPELNVLDAVYVGDLLSDTEESVEQLMLRIPACAKEGDYILETSARYAKGHFESPTETTTIHVVDGGLCTESGTSLQHKDAVQYGVAPGHVEAGSTFVVPLTITNKARNTRTFSVHPEGVSPFADIRVNPSNMMVLKGGETQVVLAHMLVDEKASNGQHTFSLHIMNEEETIGSETFTVAVTGGKGQINTLAILLTLLIVVLIVIAVLIGIAQFRSEDEPHKKPQYY